MANAAPAAKIGGSTLVQQLASPPGSPSRVGAHTLTEQLDASRTGSNAVEAAASRRGSEHATSEPVRLERLFRVKTVSGASASEATILPPSGGGDEMTTSAPGPGGEVTTPPPEPGGAGAAGSGFFQCKPTSAAIKNVQQLRNGDLYGHEFDFVVGLTYTKLGKDATASSDATLEWWEKTDRPPAWQTAVAKNTWNDMFALFPGSPTFDGWTKGRTKPIPGNETATIHDPPAASVNMPARTLEFDLKVKGGGATVAATAKQVLEPDGKGGVKTQTFKVG